MVLDPQSRQFGGMSYDSNMYSSLQPPQFTDPWAHQISNHGQYPTMSKAESRPGMSVPYAQMPPTSAPLSSGNHYSTRDVVNTPSFVQDLPRSSVSYGESHYSSPASAASSFPAPYPSMSYAQSLHHQQAQQQRKVSEV